jgi:hypothetical protein
MDCVAPKAQCLVSILTIIFFALCRDEGTGLTENGCGKVFEESSIQNIFYIPPKSN